MSTLIEGEDYYLNEDGWMVLTSAYHLRKGKCCGNGCLNCPYEYKNVATDKRNDLLKNRPPIITTSKNNLK